MTASVNSLSQRIASKQAAMQRVGDFCIHGEKVGGKKCPYHTDPEMERVGNLLAVLLDDFHEIDYDSCSFDEVGMAEMIRQFLRGEDK